MKLEVANYKTALKDDPNWRPVAGYEGMYEVHSKGFVRNAETKLLLRGGKTKAGYFTVNLSKEKICKSFNVHRIVLSAFIPNVDNKEMVNHKDGNKTNNHLANLEWVTRSENMIHALTTGIMKPRKATPVYQFDLNGNLIRKYASSVEPELYGFGSGNILHCCRGNRNMHKGYKWSFKSTIQCQS